MNAPAFTAEHQDQIASLRRDLLTLDTGRPSSLQPFATGMVQLMGFSFGLSYQLAASADGVVLTQAQGEGGPGPQSIVEFFEERRAAPDAFAAYDPLRPEAAQRNQVVEPRGMIPYEVLRETATAQWEMKNGIHHLPELRVLVCERQRLLAWVGGYREEPFSPLDYALLQALVPALRERLALESRLGLTERRGAALAAVLSSWVAPAWIVRDRDQAVVQANRAARRGPGLGARGEADPAVMVTPLTGRGETGHSLVTLRPGHARQRKQLSAQAQRWRLTARQQQVLAHVVAGDPNAVIAAELGIGLRAVERHVRALRRKARAETRAELVQAVWRDG